MKMTTIVLIAALMVVSGCSNVSQGGYYWGAYSPTYFEMVKNPSPEATEKRHEALTDIIDTSLEQELRVPPGVYAERGMIRLTQDKELALADFQAEIDTYPEAEPFIQRLISRFANDD